LHSCVSRAAPLKVVVSIRYREIQMRLVLALVRLSPQEHGEVVWGLRIDPALIVIRNVPLPESGQGQHRCGTRRARSQDPPGDDQRWQQTRLEPEGTVVFVQRGGLVGRWQRRHRGWALPIWPANISVRAAVGQ
jgi:hypothetical protein